MRLPLLLLLSALPAWSLNPRHTYITPEELQGFGDFNGDGLLDALVVERATGLYRIGTAAADGGLTWSPPRASGCPDAESLAVGRMTDSMTTMFAVTGKSANRIVLVDPSTAHSRPTVISPAGVGPASVAAVDIALPGNDPAILDLIVTSHWSSPPAANQRHLFQSLPSGIAAAGSVTTTSPVDRLSRVQLETSGPEVLGVFFRGGGEQFRLLNTANPSLPSLSSASLPAGADFVHAPFQTTPRSQFVFFVPGTTGIRVSGWTGSALSTPVLRSIGTDPVRSVHLTHDGTRFGIAVIFNDGNHAALFTFDSSGNPLPAGIVMPPAGERLTGILATSPGRFAALSGPPGAASASATPFAHNGTSWMAEAPAALPAAKAAGPRANVFLYDKEPLAHADAKLVETLHVPDWTSAFSVTGGGAGMRIAVESFSGETAGLRDPDLVFIPQAPGSDTRALVNQSFPEVSVSSESTSLGTVPIQISIDPPAGTYSRYIAPRLLVPDAAGITARFRTDATSAWTVQPFGVEIPPPGDTLTPFTVWYYAEETATGRRSAIHRADYEFTGDPGTLDSDGDGVPDFVKIQLGLDPRGGPDSDQDGMTDLEELLFGSDPANGAETVNYGGNILNLPPSRTRDSDGDGYSDFHEWIAGSDPFDAASIPAPGSLIEYRNIFDLNIRPLSHTGVVKTVPSRQSFPATDPNFSPTDVRAHDLGGRLLGSAPTRDHSPNVLPNPYAHLPALPATGRDLFVLVSTPFAFDTTHQSGEPGRGRELIGVYPIPSLDAGPVPFTATAASTAAEWVAAARVHYASLPREMINDNLDLYDTLVYLLWERIVGLKLKERGILDPALPLGLAMFRDVLASESQTATAEDLLALQTYGGPLETGYLIQSIHDAVRSEIAAPTNSRTHALRSLANEIYRISTELGTASPGLYPSPFETLRAVVRSLPTEAADVDGLIALPGDGSPATSYAAAHGLGPTDFARADAALVHLLGLIDPRPVATFTASVTPVTFASAIPLLENSHTLGGLRLFDGDGNPFIFPQALALPVGTTLEIFAFTDRTDLPAGPGLALEAISATITGFPGGTVGDLNQNAIDDDYENYFFGGPVDPFGDADGDGYINLQEALDGTNPLDPTSSPAGPPLPPGMPPVTITRSGDELTFTLEYPSAYGDRLHFLLQSSGGGLSAPFVEVPGAAAADAGSNVYSLTIPLPAADRQFYRFRLALRP